ncbi:hypothetical protein CHELA1G11_10875 [Hyphomicrobiales bacterium]|nr:hypothetical protein CHELA1G11_10875 [Hyphomicrobiales bacterium]CAH1671699.1 hypothetical protein CHELA1G2_13433 [Hyphomicrobiales bacterium]
MFSFLSLFGLNRGSGLSLLVNFAGDAARVADTFGLTVAGKGDDPAFVVLAWAKVQVGKLENAGFFHRVTTQEAIRT